MLKYWPALSAAREATRRILSAIHPISNGIGCNPGHTYSTACSDFVWRRTFNLVQCTKLKEYWKLIKFSNWDILGSDAFQNLGWVSLAEKYFLYVIFFIVEWFRAVCLFGVSSTQMRVLSTIKQGPTTYRNNYHTTSNICTAKVQISIKCTHLYIMIAICPSKHYTTTKCKCKNLFFLSPPL